jgi:hypothetical protein
MRVPVLCDVYVRILLTDFVQTQCMAILYNIRAWLPFATELLGSTSSYQVKDRMRRICQPSEYIVSYRDPAIQSPRRRAVRGTAYCIFPAVISRRF